MHSRDAGVSRSSEITLRRVTSDTVRAVCSLAVSEDQRRFVAPNAVSIAQAHFSEHAWFRAIYADGAPVGFLMLDDHPEKAEYFLWRLMVDARYQGLGIGRKAIALLVEHVRMRPGARQLLTSVHQAEGGPQSFYEKLGFRLTGDCDEGEAVLSLDLGQVRDFEYRGARALVRLHETQMRHFLDVWQAADAAKVRLSNADDPDYASREALLRHVLRSAGGYLTWICEQLNLPDPAVDPVPDGELDMQRSRRYLNHLLERWREPLVGVPAERFYRPEYLSPWKVLFCVDTMLEHAVTHPMRHRFQLEELLESQPAKPVGKPE